MTEQKHMSRAELAAAAGVPDDAIVFWIRQGLLHSETATPRKHHRYIEREARLAAILGELRLFGLNVATLRNVADHLRRCIAEFEALPHPQWQALADFGDREPYDHEGWERLVVGGAILAASGPLEVARVADGQLAVRAGASIDSFKDRSAILLNLDRVLERFRSDK